ncbi:MAG: hypothetical protein ACYSUP_11005 [Planctomycetota bacterium]|jgi:hypothetical protein
MNPEEKKQSRHYFSLQPSEKAVFESAAQIFAAYICSGKVTEANKNDYYKAAMLDAIKLASLAEKNILSDDELSAPDV